ncbi:MULTISPECIES: TRAP transporter small permease [unclassified Devosia]|uniref:TRAP transporter small permease n=1 Tax=unclassified Devosia TaxID=196773 RepID=UPI0015544685|nr:MULTISPECIES: TRAP transporter small permease [unclassified Devosia]
MNKPKFVIFRWMEHLLVLGMAVMCLLVFWNVVLRYGLRSGIPISVEISRLIFVWIIMLGSVVALREGAHLSVDAVINRLPTRARVGVLWISHLLMLGCCWLVFWGCLRQTQLNWNNVLPLSGVSSGLIYASGVVAALLWAAILLFNLFSSARGNHAALTTAALPLEASHGAGQ